MLTRVINLFLTCAILTAFAGVLQISADTEANKALALRAVDIWNTGDLDIADEIFAADFVNHDPNRPDVTDLESLKGDITEILTAGGFSAMRKMTVTK